MFKSLLKKKKSRGVPALSLSYSVGVYFNDVTMSYVLLKVSGNELISYSHKTIPLTEGLVLNSKIMEMDDLASKLVQLSREFVRYTDRIVVSLPQNFVTVDHFYYDEAMDQSLELEAEFKASQIADLDEINFDYYLFDEEQLSVASDKGALENNVIITIAKKEDVDSRMYLSEVAGLELAFLDVEGVAILNAYSYWINQENPDFEDKLIAIYDIGINRTQAVFAKKGRLLSVAEISVGASHLINQIPEYSNLDNQQLFNVLNNEFEFEQHKHVLADVQRHLAQEIYRSIRVFYSQSGMPDSNVVGIFLTGIGAKNFFLEDTLQDIVQTEVRVINPVAYAAGFTNQNQSQSDAFHLTVAFGLALRGLL